MEKTPAPPKGHEWIKSLIPEMEEISPAQWEKAVKATRNDNYTRRHQYGFNSLPQTHKEPPFFQKTKEFK